MNTTIRFLAAIFAIATFASAARAQAQKPNILLILADDMGFSDPHCYGGDIDTPNLDSLADSGLRFTDFHNTSRCWPTRSAVLTGYYPQEIHMDPPQGRLPKWTRLIPHYLHPLGYRCYQSGKWHVNGAPNVCADGGFDHSYKIDDHNNFFHPQKHTEDDKPLPPVKPGSNFYLTTYIADHCIKCLKEHQQQHTDQPFFSYLAFTSPHFPLMAPAEDIAKYKDRYLDGWDAMREKRYERQKQMGIVNCALSERDPNTIPAWNLSEAELKKDIGPGEVGHAVAWNTLTPEQKRFQATKMAIHAAMVDRMDQEIGRVVAQLKAMNAFDNTLIMFISDNGASAEQIIRGDGENPSAPPGSDKSFLCLGPGFSTACNTPFRLHKTWVHEGGQSTPLIVQWTSGIKDHGQLRHTPGHVTDFLPTFLELTGAHPDPTWNNLTPPPLPGRSILPAFASDVTVEHPYIYFNHIQHRALRIGNWKLVSLSPDPSTWELYDLTTDRSEMHNLASSEPQRVKQMADQWTKLDKQFEQEAGPVLDGGKKVRKKNKKAAE
jgi:arylsulfatase A-like enzyme